MKRILFINILFVLCVIFTGCSKDKQTLTDNTWKVESMKVHADSALMYRPDSSYFRYLPDSSILVQWGETPITLSFPKKNEYVYKAEINEAWGNVKIGNNKIIFKGAMQFSMCCDSPFANDCLGLLNGGINSYTIDNNKLILKGNKGEVINFVKQ